MPRWLLVLLALAGCSDDIIPGGDDDDDTGEPVEEPEPELTQARVLVEHDPDDDDSGFKVFVDGSPWDRLIVQGPNGGVLQVDAQGDLIGFGLSEALFDSNAHDADVSLGEILELLPEGEYVFDATSAEDGRQMRLTTILSHSVPAAPQIVTPVAGSTVEPDASLVVAWEPVTGPINGGDFDLLGYQVIVSEDEPSVQTASFFRSELSVFLPASQTSFVVPEGFLRGDRDYDIQVLAIDASGNQTIGRRTFETRD